jgi:hypothetical protein
MMREAPTECDRNLSYSIKSPRTAGLAFAGDKQKDPPP